MFTLTIRTGNAAFETCSGEEVARILRETADRIQSATATDGHLYDSNGNHVGEFSLWPEED